MMQIVDAEPVLDGVARNEVTRPLLRVLNTEPYRLG